MNKQWSLYSISSLVLLILLIRTIDQSNWGLSFFLAIILLLQVTGTIFCVHQNRNKKGVPTSKAGHS